MTMFLKKYFFFISNFKNLLHTQKLNMQNHSEYLTSQFTWKVFDGEILDPLLACNLKSSNQVFLKALQKN
jgi:hypothetical protein